MVINMNKFSIMKEVVPKGELELLMKAIFNTLLVNKGRSLKYFVIFDEGDTIINIPNNYNERLEVINTLLSYFETSEEYEKCQELLLFKNLAKRQWGIK